MIHFIELRAEEVQELLSRPPKGLLRWGITVIFGIMLILLIGAYMIHYPDLVQASFKLTSNNAPKVVLARSEGKLVRSFVQDGQHVQVGAILAYLESTAQHDEVLRLSSQLASAWKTARRGNLEGLGKLNLSSYSQLGELQNAYQLFAQTHIQLQAYLTNGFYNKKKAMLQLEIMDLQALANNLRQQQQILKHDQTLAEEDYAIQQKLFKEKVLSPLDIKREESKLTGRQLSYRQMAAALISNLTTQRAKQKEILELDRLVAEERNKFLQSLNTLQSSIESWKTKYILRAPVNGKVIMVETLQENQSVSLNQALFYVAPPYADYIGELRIRQHNAGKVLVGQDVLIKFSGYPFQEFGAVRGRITAIASMPLNDSVFLAKVELPTGLKTTYGKTLSFKAGMNASAEVITDDKRLIEKLFYQLRKLT